ncbi:hypothetical protein J4E06_06630 [Muricauda sp. NFXS6]|uniref:hypothetical protein n=1 Tax=Allomuricauda sp. NFXS6 TaxID=2819094 RepID=UPI0032DEAE0E
MKNDDLSQIWKSQNSDLTLDKPDNIIKKARKQRNGQFATIAVLSITIIILMAFAIKYASSDWNNFTLGLLLMISSLGFRVIIEFVSIYRKESQLIALDNRTYQEYLKKYYGIRLKANYIITPICFGVYILGFTMLLPYFKSGFTEGFYNYILISGIVSLAVIALIVIKSVLREHLFLKQLNRR